MSVWYLWPIIHSSTQWKTTTTYNLTTHHTYKKHFCSLFHAPKYFLQIVITVWAYNTMLNCLYACLSQWTVLFILASPEPTRPSTWLAYIKCSLNWTEQKISHSFNQHGFGPEHPKHSCSHVFCCTGWQTQSQVPCNVSSQREPVGKRYFIKSLHTHGTEGQKLSLSWLSVWKRGFTI